MKCKVEQKLAVGIRIIVTTWDYNKPKRTEEVIIRVKYQPNGECLAFMVPVSKIINLATLEYKGDPETAISISQDGNVKIGKHEPDECKFRIKELWELSSSFEKRVRYADYEVDEIVRMHCEDGIYRVAPFKAQCGDTTPQEEKQKGDKI